MKTHRLKVLVLLTALLATACAGPRSSRGNAPDESPGSTRVSCGETDKTSGDRGSFAAPVQREGDRLRMSVTFPDATTAEVVFPASKPILAFRAWPVVTMYLAGRPYSARQVRLTYGPPDPGLKVGDRPIECYQGAQGIVEVWASGWEDLPHWIFFPLGAWTARIGDGNEGRFLSERERALWASGLASETDRGGWPVLKPTGEIRFGVPFEDGRLLDVALEFWEEDGNRGVLLWSVSCQSDPSDRISRDIHGEYFGNFCFRDAPMTVHVYGGRDEDFVRSLAQELRIENVSLAHPTEEYSIVP